MRTSARATSRRPTSRACAARRAERARPRCRSRQPTARRERRQPEQQRAQASRFDPAWRYHVHTMTPSDCILFSGGAPGAEAAFGACAERHGIEEVNFTFEGHKIERHRGVRVLNHEELQNGDVSLAYVSRLMHRRFTDAPTMRRILQTIWYQVNNGQEIYVIGAVLEDGTVRGGTGWGAEF